MNAMNNELTKTIIYLFMAALMSEQVQNTIIDICSNWILSVRVKVNNDCRGQIDISTTRSTHNQTHHNSMQISPTVAKIKQRNQCLKLACQVVDVRGSIYADCMRLHLSRTRSPAGG
jgi:hypothetical protein